jgi:ankyrin repeat protein
VGLIIKRGDSAYDEISELLKKGTNPNAKILNGLPMSHFAANSGFVRIVELLLQNGATVNRLTIGGTALMHATQWRRVDVVKALLLHGGDANLPPRQRVCPYTTIVSSCQQYV